MCGLTQNCVEQSFDNPPLISVSKNTALSDDFAVNIHSYLAGVTAKLGMLISTVSRFLCGLSFLLLIEYCSVSVIGEFK